MSTSDVVVKMIGNVILSFLKWGSESMIAPQRPEPSALASQPSGAVPAVGSTQGDRLFTLNYVRQRMDAMRRLCESPTALLRPVT
jgi:hypothetical protein